MQLHRLTARGLELFDAFLEQFKGAADQSLPKYLLEEKQYAETTSDVEVLRQDFESQHALAAYLDQLLSRLDNRYQCETDVGLWSWLALYFFEQCCPKSRNGIYEPGETAHWIPAFNDHQRRLRHFLAGPYRIYCTHKSEPDVARIMLHQKPGKIGHFYYQLGQRQELVRNRTILEVASRLYYNPAQNRAKVGAVTRERNGSVFRYVRVLNQLDLNWDLSAISPDQLWAKLPPEFDAYKKVSV